MTRSGLGALGLCIAVWLVPASRAADAQTLTSASVTGTVHDASGAVIPGATVDIVNLRTNQAQQAVTDARGRFRLLYLPVGDYALTVQLAGFGSTRTALTLKVGDQIDLPIVLQAATVTEAVQVEAAAPLVEARRTEVSAAVSPQEVDTLPLNGRNYLDLALLAPNVSRTNLRSTDRFAETSAVAGTAVSISGQRNLANSFIVDGLSANDDAADLAGTFFSEEVVREFQVVTSGGVAEFGRASGGTVSVVTKSGGNNLTGRAYEFFRGDLFDARNPLSTRRDGSTNAPLKDPLRQNQYGLSMGGPIAKDRAFWFGSFERTQLDRTGIVTIAPAAVVAINRVLDRGRLPGPEGDDRQLSDRLHHEQRVRPRRRSGDAALASAGALQPVRRRERERAERRRAERRQPRRRARRYGSDRRDELSVHAVVRHDQRGARAVHAQRSGRAGERRHRAGRERQRRRELGHGHLLADRACARCRPGG